MIMTLDVSPRIDRTKNTIPHTKRHTKQRRRLSPRVWSISRSEPNPPSRRRDLTALLSVNESPACLLRPAAAGPPSLLGRPRPPAASTRPQHFSFPRVRGQHTRGGPAIGRLIGRPKGGGGGMDGDASANTTMEPANERSCAACLQVGCRPSPPERAARMGGGKARGEGGTNSRATRAPARGAAER